MNPAIYIPIIVLWIIIFTMLRSQKNVVASKKIIEKRQKGDKSEVLELAKRFIDKECILYSFDGIHQYDGVIKEVTAGAILIEKDGQLEAINADFVIRIREYPKNKKGKKKSLVLD